jgi:phosphotriesterase-related protein
MADQVMTVTGPVDVEQLGFTLMHEHVMVSASGMYRSYPDLLGPNRFERAVACLKEAKAGDIDTMVDATTFDLGRDPELLRAVSAASGVNIINVTGWWLDVPRFIRHVSPNQMAREFIRDIEEGFRGTDVKAGVLKKRCGLPTNSVSMVLSETPISFRSGITWWCM